MKFFGVVAAVVAVAALVHVVRTVAGYDLVETNSATSDNRTPPIAHIPAS